jgi:hypothetical protein
MDYPGFGKSVGSRNEALLLKAADQLLKLSTQGKDKDSVVIYGKGFGTTLAAYVASYYQPGALILETPFYSMPSLLHQYACIYPVSKMSVYQLPEYQWLKEVNCPVMMISNEKDGYGLKSEFTKLKKSVAGKQNVKAWIQTSEGELYKDKSFLSAINIFLQ